MDNRIVVNAQKREDLGKKGSKKVRREGRVPGVVYGKDQLMHFSVLPFDMRDVIYTPDFKVIDLTIDGEVHPCILKDVQFHPVTEEIVHIDLLQLVPEHPVKLEVPVRFEGQSPGVKLGGRLVQSLRRIKIKCTPENMVHELSVDVSELELGHAVRVRDVQAPEGIEIMNSPGIPLASVQTPRALRSATSAAEKEAGGEAGEEVSAEAEE
jgi:large subunit ribosomal protein L25